MASSLRPRARTPRSLQRALPSARRTMRLLHRGASQPSLLLLCWDPYHVGVREGAPHGHALLGDLLGPPPHLSLPVPTPLSKLFFLGSLPMGSPSFSVKSPPWRPGPRGVSSWTPGEAGGGGGTGFLTLRLHPTLASREPAHGRGVRMMPPHGPGPDPFTHGLCQKQHPEGVWLGPQDHSQWAGTWVGSQPAASTSSGHG